VITDGQREKGRKDRRSLPQVPSIERVSGNYGQGKQTLSHCDAMKKKKDAESGICPTLMRGQADLALRLLEFVLYIKSRGSPIPATQMKVTQGCRS